MIGNLAADTVQCQSHISSDLAEAGGAQRNNLHMQSASISIRAHSPKRQSKSNAECWTGDKAERSKSSENSSPSEGVETRQPISEFIILSTASASDNASSPISFS